VDYKIVRFLVYTTKFLTVFLTITVVPIIKDNFYESNSFFYILGLAQRHKSTVHKIYAKHGQDMQVKYQVETKTGPIEKSISLNLRKKIKDGLLARNLLQISSLSSYKNQTTSCICGCDSTVEMHHI
jgi:hypothetical protein